MQASVVVTHSLSYCVTCGIFQDQGSNHIPCIGRQIPNHWTTGEVPENYSCVSVKVQKELERERGIYGVVGAVKAVKELFTLLFDMNFLISEIPFQVCMRCVVEELCSPLNLIILFTDWEEGLRD